jgi:hypothetical protein
VACGERRSRYMGGDGHVEDRWHVVRGGVDTREVMRVWKIGGMW